MRIVIDMQGAQTESRYRGIGRYTLSLAQAITRNRGDHEVILALNGLFPDTIEPIRAAFDGLLAQENIRIWSCPGPTFEADMANALRCRAAELLRETFLASLQPDFVLVSSLFEGIGDNAITSIGRLERDIPTAVILYDLIPLLSPDEHFRSSRIHQEFYGRKIESLKQSTCLLAISESARQEALQELKFSEDRIINISGACDSSFRIMHLKPHDRESLNKRMGISRPFVMYTGGADDRKNLHRLIKAYAGLPDRVRCGHQLVLAGKMPVQLVESFKRTANLSGLADDEVVITGYVSDDDLVGLYNTCKAFIFPSLHEGFGLPPLEAMACGAPAIAANSTSLPEVIGCPEALFDPESVDSISRKLQQVLTDDDFHSRLVHHAKNQVKLFSWDESAKRALLAIQRFASDRSSCQRGLAFTNTKISRLRRAHLAVKSLASGRTEYQRGLVSTDNQSSRLLTTLAALLPLEGVSDSYLCSLSQCIADNEGRTGLPQLLLDVSTIVHSDAKSGIQRVVRSLLLELIESPPTGYVTRPIFLDGTRYRYADNLLQKAYEGKEVEGQFISFWGGDIYLSLDLNMHLVPVMHRLHEKMRAHGVLMNYIVYDLLLATNPDWWNPPNPELFLNWLKSISTVSDNLIGISNAVADELHAWLRENPPLRLRGAPNVTSFHLGADIVNSSPSFGLPDDAQDVLAYLQQHPSFLMVGTMEPRKGHAQVLEAFEQLWQAGKNVNLVIVGKLGWLVDDIAERIRTHSELNKRLHWLEGISDEYLEKVYASSTCLIAASYGEGFGLPLIEAAQHKLPILARDIPVFREVAGENAFYFSGNSPKELSESINEWIVLFNKQVHPKSDELPWLTWKESAAQLIKILINEKTDCHSEII
jgi:glycosyltransferase involved in cell wall biosynthesis